ncbi:MAG: hypothetical protein BGO05_19975 [Rhizobiales bacterium 63-7]|nr:phosphatase PAP2 family protein [Hyphomicrobiales bacterium]OJU68417.1 MAG: hypothetical protein BGO05_19975 [Rhizobiales bacterium 63-7]
MLLQPRLLLFSMTLLAYGIVFALAWMVGPAVEYGSIMKLCAVLIPVFGAAIAYTMFRRMEPMRVLLECILCGLLLSVPVGLSTYIAMGANFPLADERLMRMDAALGFDWRAFIRFVDARPLLAESLGQAYQSFGLQLLGIPILLAAFGRYARCYAMVLGYGLLCFLSILISLWYPALGTYSVYAVAPQSLDNINAHFGYAFLEQFNAVRSDPDFVFSFPKMMGIVTFPSVHAAAAVLCAWAMWDIRLLRYPFLALNVLMAVSAISHANHYLVDVIAGIGVASISISSVSALCNLRAHAPVRTAKTMVAKQA